MCVLWTPLLSSLWADVIVDRCYPLGTYRIHTSDFMLCGEAFGEKKNQGHGETNLHSCQRATGTMPLFSRGSRNVIFNEKLFKEVNTNAGRSWHW